MANGFAISVTIMAAALAHPTLAQSSPQSMTSSTAKAAPKAVAAAPARPRAPACVTEREAEAFRMRHLQSRLMVAGLSCGQRDAYNAFMTRHKDELGVFGPVLIGYYRRTGAGEVGLNKFVTEVANGAASLRAENPNGYCNQTWTTFWELQQNPTQLASVAADNPVPGVVQPSVCPPAPPAQKKTAAPTKDAAAR